MMSPVLVFVALLSVACAQSSSQEIEPTQTMDMMESSNAAMQTPAPMVTANSSLAERYNAAQATNIRQRHFYCLNDTTTAFPPEMSNPDGTVDPFYWSIMLQYPVLSFLDVRRKENLFNLIVSLARDGAAATSGVTSNALQSLNETDLCIGPVDNYRVSYYEESVLVRIYFRNIVVTPEDPQTGVSIESFNRYFLAGFMAAARSQSDTRVQSFRSRDAIAINSVSLLGGLIRENFHPGGRGLAPEDDPTLRAVLISTSVGNATIDYALAPGNRTQEFATNPRPINYGLEAGDIVFAVFGSIFLTIVVALTILGFCIHPFFLA